jgi:hypothetical protein
LLVPIKSRSNVTDTVSSRVVTTSMPSTTVESNVAYEQRGQGVAHKVVVREPPTSSVI